jgi:5-methylcytosine-specific restriction enzyme A
MKPNEYKTCQHCSMPIVYGTCSGCKPATSDRSLSSKVTSSGKWKKVRDMVRDRDSQICQACLSGNHFVPNNRLDAPIEIHHIIKVTEDLTLAYDSTNLIALCKYHHEEADHGKISKHDLQAIALKNEAKYNGGVFLC